MEGWGGIRKCQASEKEENRTHSLCYWGRFYGRRLQSFKFFLSLNNKKRRDFSRKRDPLGACCLTILICLIVLNVLRGRCNHATPTFSELKVSVYRMKGKRLQDER